MPEQGAPSEESIHPFFNDSPLKESYCSITIEALPRTPSGGISDDAVSLLFKSFPKGYLRVKSPDGVQDALYFFDSERNSEPLRSLNTTPEQLTKYDQIIGGSDKPAALSTYAVKAINQLINHHTGNDVSEQIKSSPTIGSPLDHIITFKIKPLLKTNPAILQYLTPAQKQFLKHDLHIAFYQLLAQYRAEDPRNLRGLKTCEADIERCASLLHHLALVESGKGIKAPAKQVEKSLNENILEYWQNRWMYLRLWIRELNTWRLYWGWAGETQRTTMMYMQKDCNNIQTSIEITATSNSILRIISVIILSVQLLINFILILTHTFKYPWMSQEEKDLIDRQGGTWNRFTELLAEEKFNLINDLVWAANGLLAIFWLSKLDVGYYGDIFMGVFLTLDTILAVMAKKEAEEKQAQEIKYYDDAIIRLKKQIDDEVPETRERKILSEQTLFAIDRLNKLEKAKAECTEHWEHQLKHQTILIYYCTATIASFILTAIPWAKIGAEASAEAIVLGATISCFVLLLMYSGYQAYLGVTQAKGAQLSALEECLKILNDGNFDEHACTANYLSFKDLEAQAKYQEEMATHQYYIFIRTLIVQSIIPIAIFCGFAFSTFGISVAVFAIVVAVGILTHYALEYIAPKEAERAEFNQNKYDEFLKNKDSLKNEIGSKVSKMDPKTRLSVFPSPQEDDQGDEQKLITNQPGNLGPTSTT